MKRLTRKTPDGRVFQERDATITDVFYTLAAYEDTGMTPEEIEKMKKAYYEVVVERDKLRGGK